jgi:hypothetical protein
MRSGQRHHWCPTKGKCVWFCWQRCHFKFVRKNSTSTANIHMSTKKGKHKTHIISILLGAAKVSIDSGSFTY